MKKALQRLALVKVCVIAVLCFGFGGVAFSQTLWQTTKSGMSVDAVKKLFPQAVSMASPNANHEDKEWLCLDNQTLANLLFDVNFVFSGKDKRLAQVTLDCKEKLVSSRSFDDLSEKLSVKYGTPLASKKTSISRETSWLSGKTNITLFFVEVGSEKQLFIVYQTRLVEEAGDF